jgi:hypothetical protein
MLREHLLHLAQLVGLLLLRLELLDKFLRAIAVAAVARGQGVEQLVERREILHQLDGGAGRVRHCLRDIAREQGHLGQR